MESRCLGLWLFIATVIWPTFCKCQCPFPGVTRDGTAFKNGKELLQWDQPGTVGPFNARDVIKYACNPGFRIPSHQSSEITCQPNGVWNKPIPHCDKILKGEDLTISLDWTPQSLSEMDCRKSGYSSMQVSQRFSITPMNVTDVIISFCNTSSTDVQVFVEESGEHKQCRVTSNETLKKTFNCQHQLLYGYIELRFAVGTSINGLTVTAHTDHCDYPPIPLHSHGHFSPLANNEFEYECDDGYEMQGSESIVCQPNGQWSELPRCKSGSSNLIYIIIGVVIGVLVLVIVVAVLVARKKRTHCFADTVHVSTENIVDTVPKPVAADHQSSSKSEHAYVNIAGVGGNQEVTYTEPLFVGQDAATGQNSRQLPQKDEAVHYSEVAKSDENQSSPLKIQKPSRKKSVPKKETPL